MASAPLTLARIGAAVVAATLAGGAARAELVTGEKYQDWTAGCEPRPAGQGQACFIFQRLTDPGTGQQPAAIAVGYDQPGAGPVAVITLPLGILLPPGISLRVQNRPPQTFPVYFCNRDACRSQFPLSPETINALKAGSTADLTFQDLSGKGITLPISLKGFTKGFAALR